MDRMLLARMSGSVKYGKPCVGSKDVMAECRSMTLAENGIAEQHVALREPQQEAKVRKMEPSGLTEETEKMLRCIHRLKSGDASAREELIESVQERLMRLSRTLKRDYGQVVRWEQTEDVFQGAVLRLYKALGETEIRDLEHFLRLAALQIRRELIDLARKHRGVEGFAANHHTQAGAVSGDADARSFALDPAEYTHDPASVQEWAELHELIGQLPEEQRKVVDLLLYHGMSQADAAEVLRTSVRTIKRNWRNAKISLWERLGSRLPEQDAADGKSE